MASFNQLYSGMGTNFLRCRANSLIFKRCKVFRSRLPSRIVSDNVIKDQDKTRHKVLIEREVIFPPNYSSSNKIVKESTAHDEANLTNIESEHNTDTEIMNSLRNNIERRKLTTSKEPVTNSMKSQNKTMDMGNQFSISKKECENDEDALKSINLKDIKNTEFIQAGTKPNLNLNSKNLNDSIKDNSSNNSNDDMYNIWLYPENTTSCEQNVCFKDNTDFSSFSANASSPDKGLVGTHKISVEDTNENIMTSFKDEGERIIEQYSDQKPEFIEKIRKGRAKKSRNVDECFKAVKTSEEFQIPGLHSFKLLNEMDSKFCKFMTDVMSNKNSEKRSEIYLEGRRLIEDAISSGCFPKVILFSKLIKIRALKIPEETKVYKVKYQALQMWSELTTSPGIAGIFPLPNVSDKTADENSLPLTIICDNVREPGNLGAILRIAAGVGCKNVVLTKGCVNLWDSKVLRSAAGSHFKIPIQSRIPWDEVKYYIEKDAAVFLADNNINPDDAEESYENFKAEQPGDVEANQISLYEYTKQALSLPLLPYYGVQFTNYSSVVIVIGGETEGLSHGAFSLARTRNGARLNVPLNNGIESLNTGSALSVIGFELKKQFLTAYSEGAEDKLYHNVL